MERNPYLPPQSPVSDIPSAAVASPRDVLLSCNLQWVFCGLWLVDALSDLLNPPSVAPKMGGAPWTLIGPAIGLAVSWWVVSKLKAGRNWMRLLLTVAILLNYVSIPIFWNFSATNILPIYAKNPIKAGVAVLETISGVCSVILLNTSRSRAWFAASKREALRAA